MKYVRSKFVPNPLKINDIFMRPNPIPGYYNYIKILDDINANTFNIGICDYNGNVKSTTTMLKRDAQTMKNIRDKEKFNETQKISYEVNKLCNKLKLDTMSEYDLKQSSSVNMLNTKLKKLKEISKIFDVNNSSVPASGFSGANSYTMKSSRSGIAIDVDVNGVHRGGYYGTTHAYLVQVRIGGALDSKITSILRNVVMKLLSKFRYETELGKSFINITDGTNWSSVMLTAPQNNNNYSIIQTLISI